jgi:hypothetical protein
MDWAITARSRAWMDSPGCSGRRNSWVHKEVLASGFLMDGG